MSRTINVFTNPNCMPCKMTKRWLNEHNLPYNELQIADYAEELREFGYQSAPVVQVIDADGAETTWSGGYNVKQLQALVND